MSTGVDRVRRVNTLCYEQAVYNAHPNRVPLAVVGGRI